MRQDEQGMATTRKVQLLLLPSLAEARSSGGAGEAVKETGSRAG